ncbi:MAG TPA: hypothetical protein VGX71_26745 [Pseudaminobacter sp.]|nr:hypothetical protein [Pseudaminobacter sp.]
MKKINLFLAAVAIGLGIEGGQAQQKDQAAPQSTPQPIDSKKQREQDVKAFVGAATSLQFVTEELERKYSVDLSITDINNYRFKCTDGDGCAWICVFAAQATGDWCSCYSESDGCSCGC